MLAEQIHSTGWTSVSERGPGSSQVVERPVGGRNLHSPEPEHEHDLLSSISKLGATQLLAYECETHKLRAK